jgi:hypothetical protein
VQFDSFFYRIPYGFAGKTVSIRATSRSIEVFSEGERIAALMASREHPEQAFKTCAGILRLGDTLPRETMEAACQQAVLYNIYTYQYFNRLLKQTPPPDTLPIAHPNLRGKAYYAPSPEDLAKEALHA